MWESLATGALGGILASSVAQFVGYLLSKRSQRQRREREWYMRVITSTRSLLRRARAFEPSSGFEGGIRTTSPDEVDDPQLQVILTLIRDLRQIHDEMPMNFYNSEVDQALPELTKYYNSSTIGDEKLSAVEFKHEIISESKEMLDAIESQYSDAENLY